MSSVTTTSGAKLRLNQYLNNNNIAGFAIKNYRHRFLIPSCTNSFGGIIIEYVLIDSGSNSSLFPLPFTSDKIFDIDNLVQTFPYDKYVWSIGTAHGLGLIPDTTLHIKSISSDNGSAMYPIKCNLHFDIKSLNFDLPYLRFPLNKDSIKMLIDTADIPFSDFDREILQNTFKFLNEFDEKFPMMINKNKRDYCLLGQHFLRNFASIQINDVIIFVDTQKLRDRLFPLGDSNITEIADFLYHQRPGFSKTENFLNCEDNEHGGKDLFNVSDQQIDIDE